MPNSTDSLSGQKLKETRFPPLLNQPFIDIYTNMKQQLDHFYP